MNKKGSASIIILTIIVVLLILAIGGMVCINVYKTDRHIETTEADNTATPSSNETAAQTMDEKPIEPADDEKSDPGVRDDTPANETASDTENKDIQQRIETVRSITEVYSRTAPEGHEDMRGLNATELVSELRCGWNLGNSLDSAGSETNWGNPATTREMIDAIAAKGFNTIRIPVSWGQYTQVQSDTYVINPEFLQRVGDVVDYAVENDMYVILNTHHETGWLIPTDKMMGDSADKFQDIWTQIALYFKDYGDHLIFEGLNEPRDEGGEKEWEGGTAENRRIISELEDSFIETVRATGGNNEKRLLLITSEAACFMDSALKDVHVPDDPYVGVSIHAYTPYDFTFSHEGDYDDWDGSHKSDIVWTFNQLNKYFLSKGIPVVMTEFGAERKGGSDDNNDEEVVKWMRDYMSLASKYKVPVVIWDNNLVNGNGERFGLFNRKTLKWEREKIVDTMIEGYQP
ncbi:MAG: glycoside hydrolase family 5 protein [Lachnospiraceae bacterium]|nr:glycoside hydrolase family 5 protein [Lachnospiraceae bacterium]